MKKVNTPFLLLLIGTLFLVYSCGETVSKKESGETPAVKEIKETEEPRESASATKKSDILIENKVLHAFSDPSKKDEFRIAISGKSLLKGKVLFTITNSEGKNLLREEFDANYLLGYDFTGNINSKKETDAFIQKRIREFFSEDRFNTPAIEEDVVFEDQSYYIDKETWEEVKANKQSIGFYYLLGSEDGRHIAFSGKKGKVVMFYNCC
ncbi:MAG: hypothetical protein K0S23_3275 [Fluviicola sp.]|jgi:hypothetical protein|uniref:hypothetical protein n=1 Tax=Fluviicola sp. TaxID=1917219 RepID=UPI00262D241A|nr:hypothetical protein [Fluviicola sp.]MDF3028968.1 hypothetical protein [Fluviicola sp.]